MKFHVLFLVVFLVFPSVSVSSTKENDGGNSDFCSLSQCSGRTFGQITSGLFTRSGKKGTGFYCWTNDDKLTYCDLSSRNSAFQLVYNQKLSIQFPCYGNVNFTFQGTNYWLNGSTVLTQNKDSKWAAVGDSSFMTKYNWFLSRLRPNEASGSFYCWAVFSNNSLFDQEIFQPYYFDGSYYWDLIGTDSKSFIQKQRQSVPQYQQLYFHYVSDQNYCNGPVCCWFQDSKMDQPVEKMFNGSHWLVWNGSDKTYNLYSGDLTEGAVACTNYFSVRSSKNSGSDSDLSEGIYGFNLTDLSINANNKGSRNNYYYYLSPLNGLGMFHNASGEWRCRIQNGAFVYVAMLKETLATRPTSAPTNDDGDDDCSDTFIWNLFADSTASNSKGSSSNNIARQAAVGCDPSPSARKNGGCDKGYSCQRMPEIFNMPTCTEGFCIPIYTKFCDTDEAVSVKATFGAKCQNGTDCYTGTCTEGVCSCQTAYQVLPTVDYSWKYGKAFYRERCVASQKRVVTAGDVCRSKKGGRIGDCAFGSFCGKCPESSRNQFVASKCISVNSSSSSSANATCPSKCGYLATCKVVGGQTPMCTCPPGYNREQNLRDCYGWKLVNVTQCSVTCGDGVKTVTQICDKAANSTATCEGNAVVSVPCATGEPCPANSTLLPALVQVKFCSTVLTVDIFQSELEASLKSQLAWGLNTKCTVNKSTYETQCCPGSTWPSPPSVSGNSSSQAVIIPDDCLNNETSVVFLNEYTNGSLFSFYVMVHQADPQSRCCLVGVAQPLRHKRSTSFGAFDQSALEEMMADPSMISQMSSTLQIVDPSASLSTSSISSATPTSRVSYSAAGSLQQQDSSSTTAAASVTSAAVATPKFFDFANGFPVWGAGLFAGLLSAVIIAVVVVLVILVTRKKKAEAIKRQQSAMAQRQIFELRRPFVLGYDATHEPIDRDTCYPSFYAAYPPHERSATRPRIVLAPKSAHEVERSHAI